MRPRPAAAPGFRHAIRAAGSEMFLAAYLVCELCSVAGVIVMGGGFGSGFFGFGFAAVASPAATAVADALSLGVSFGAATLGFGFAAAVSTEEAAAV